MIEIILLISLLSTTAPEQPECDPELGCIIIRENEQQIEP
jgi:hypothetical protein